MTRTSHVAAMAVLLLSPVVLLTGMPAAAQSPDNQPPGASVSQAGMMLFMSDCATCHQANASGGLKVGNAVSADLRSPGLENTYHHSDALILRAILEGKDEEGGPLDAPMPHWKGQMSEQQAMQVLAYLKTLCCSPSPESKEPKTQQ